MSCSGCRILAWLGTMHDYKNWELLNFSDCQIFRPRALRLYIKGGIFFFLEGNNSKAKINSLR